MSRRGLCCVLSLILVALIGAPAALAANPIQTENALPGDSDWTAATQDPVSANPPIAGYANANSVRPGQTINFQVTTSPVARYRIEISRLGWYGGSGGRRITCLVGSALDPSCTLDHLGVARPSSPPPDPVTGEMSDSWPTTDTLTVPSSWTSGYYLAVFQLTSGPSAGQTGFTPFIVEAAAGDRAAILVQVPANTWQAYNDWGGEGFYTTPRAVKVSFNRPYDHRLLFDWEYPLVRFLERGGWDVSYATDDDVDADPSILLDHKLDMDAGHDEYWTKVMRDGWEAARAAGVNLAFMGANASFWQVRYEDGGRTMVGYKYSPDPEPNPALKTTEFRYLTPARPECELFGVEFQNVVLIHRNIDAVADPAVAEDPWFAGSGLKSGSVLSGLGGGETDEITPGCHVPPVTPLLSYSGAPLSNGTPVRGDAVRYTACSGAEVFSGGSLQFSWGLDSWRDPSYSTPGSGQPPVPPANAGLQQAMTNALGDLTRSHVPTPGPPHICVPTPSISVPVAWAAVGQQVQLVSSSTDQFGQISSQRWEVSLGRGSVTSGAPSVTRTFQRSGTAHINLLVTDSSGATAATDRTLPVCQCPTFGHAHANPWPPGSQDGGPCQVMAIGSLGDIGHRLWFLPHRAMARLTVATYRVQPHAGRLNLVRLATISAARSSAPLPIPTTAASVVVEVTARVAGHLWHQQFLVSHGRAASVAQGGLLNESLCDGTSGQVLTPAFRGRAFRPLRIAVTGAGRVTVSLMRPGGETIYRRVMVVAHKSTVISIASRHLPSGLYRVAVSAWHSKLPQPVRLTALAL